MANSIKTAKNVISNDDNFHTHIIVVLGKADDATLTATGHLIKKNRLSVLYDYRINAFGILNADGAVVPVESSMITGDVHVEFVGHGSTTLLGGLDVFALSQVLFRLTECLGNDATVAKLNLVGCNTDGDKTSAPSLTSILSRSFPTIAIHGYQGAITVNSTGEIVATSSDDPSALSLDDIIKKIKEDSKLTQDIADSVVQHATDQVSHGPLFLGENHVKPLGKEVLDYLAHAGLVNNVFLELPDLMLVPEADIATFGANGKLLSALKQNAIDSGADTFSEYFNSLSYDEKLKAGETLKSVFGSGFPAPEEYILPDRNINVYFCDIPSVLAANDSQYFPVDGKIDPLVFFNSTLNARNKYMADTIRAILKGGDGTGSVILVGAKHLGNKSDKGIRSLQSYFNAPDSQTFDVSSVPSLRREIAGEVERNLRFKEYPDQVYLRPEYIGQFTYPVNNDNPEAMKGDTASAQRLIDISTFIKSAANISDIVNKYQSSDASVHFAPQSFVVGNVSATGICDSLSEAWLFALSQDTTGTLKTTLLDDIFLRSQSLLASATEQGRLPGQLSDQVTAFLNTLSGLQSSGTRTVESLADIVHTLTSSTSDISLSLHSGNHAFALARRTVNGKVSYFLFDPNIGEICLPAGTGTQSEANLNALLNDIFNMKVGTGSGSQTLADFYQTVSSNGDLTFTVQTFDPQKVSALTEYQNLKTLLGEGVQATIPDDTASHDLPVVPSAPAETPAVVMSPALQTLRQSAQDKLTSLETAATLQTMKQTAHDAAQRLVDKFTQVIKADAGDATKLTITGVDVLPKKSDSDDMVLRFTSHAEDGTQHVTDVPLTKDDIMAGVTEQENTVRPENATDAEGSGFFLKSLGIYSFLTSVTGLIGSIGRGDVTGAAVNGTLLATTLSDMTGLADKLADRVSTLAGITGTEAFGGGLSGLMGKGVSELAQLVGAGADLAGAAGHIVAGAPLLQMGATGYSIYSDVKSLQAADNTDAYGRAVGTLATDVVSGAVAAGSTVAAIAGTISSEAAGGIGGLAAAVGILIDVMINPDNPLGLRDLFNKDSETIKGMLENLTDLAAAQPEELYKVLDEATPDGQEDSVLSFAFSAKDLPAVKKLTTLANWKALSGYLKDIASTDLWDLSQSSTVPEKCPADLAAVASSWQPLLANALNALHEQNVNANNYLNDLLNPDSLMPKFAANGNLNVVMSDSGQDFTLFWTTPAAYDGGDTRVTGPEISTVRPVSLSQITDDIVMGAGSSQTLRYHWSDAYFKLDSWDENTGPTDMDVVSRDNDGNFTLESTDLDGVNPSSIDIVPFDHHFFITGNVRDNKFYSVWTDPDQAYEYDVNGGEGSDSLFVSPYGQYYFNGGADGQNGDTLVAYQAKVESDDSADWTEYDLDRSSNVVTHDDITLRNNFSVHLTNVENITGSLNNEIFHGDSGKNIILTNGGEDKVWLSGGGDTYVVNGATDGTSITSSITFKGQVDRASDAIRDTVYLRDITINEITLSGTGDLTTDYYGGLDVHMDPLASSQIVLVTADNNTLVYNTEKGWFLDLSQPLDNVDNLSNLPSLNTLMTGGVLSIMSPWRLTSLKCPVKFYLTLHPRQDGTACTVQFEGDKPVAVSWTLPAGFASPAFSNSIKLSEGIPSVNWQTTDGLSFHLVQQPDAAGASQTVMVVDSIDMDVLLKSHPGMVPHTSLFGANGIINPPGIDVVVFDATTILNTSDAFPVGAPAGGYAVVQYHSATSLTPESLPSLSQWMVDDTSGLMTIKMPDGVPLYSTTDHDIQELTVLDNDDNSIDVLFAEGGGAHVLFKNGPARTQDIPDIIKQATALFGASGLNKWQIQTADGVTFHLDTAMGADGKNQTVMVVDSIDMDVLLKSHPGMAAFTPLFGEKGYINFSGIDAMVYDITDFTGDSYAFPVGALAGAQTVLQYRSATSLTPDSLLSLSQWTVDDINGLMTIKMPDGVDMYSTTDHDIQELTVLDKDDNSINIQFASGKAAQVMFKSLSSNFDISDCDFVGFLDQAMNLFGASGLSKMNVQTGDGVTFHFEDTTGTDGISQINLVVDSIDTSKFMDQYEINVIGDQKLPPQIGLFVMDITSVIQDAARQQKKFIIDNLHIPMLLKYQSAKTVSLQDLLSMQKWEPTDYDDSTDASFLNLPDGHVLHSNDYKPVTMGTLTLEITDPTGHDWQITYERNTDGDVVMTQALDISGQSDTEIIQGQPTVFCKGDSVQKTGVTVDLSQTVQKGAGVTDENLAGIMNVMGSAYADVITGDGNNNILYGQGGDDVLSGGGGTDWLIGGTGADTYVVNTGEHVLISSQDKDTTTDKLIFTGSQVGQLKFALDQDDLLVSSGDREAVLKDWGKGNTHYALSVQDAEMNEGEFVNLVQTAMPELQVLKKLSSLYTSLAPKNQGSTANTEAPPSVTTITLAPDKWTSEDAIVNHDADSVEVTEYAVLDQDSGEIIHADADYRLTVVSDAPDDMLSAFHIHLKAGDTVIAAQTIPVVSQGIKRHFELDVDSATLAYVADGTTTFSVEIDQDAGHGSSIIHSVQLQRLTGAMATFGGGEQGINSVGSTPVLQPAIQPQLAVVS